MTAAGRLRFRPGWAASMRRAFSGVSPRLNDMPAARERRLPARAALAGPRPRPGPTRTATGARVSNEKRAVSEYTATKSNLLYLIRAYKTQHRTKARTAPRGASVPRTARAPPTTQHPAGAAAGTRSRPRLGGDRHHSDADGAWPSASRRRGSVALEVRQTLGTMAISWRLEDAALRPSESARWCACKPAG